MLKKLLPAQIRKPLGYFKWKLMSQAEIYYYYYKTIFVTRYRPQGKKHNLPSPLIISLTSYKPRFETLYPTLVCLLTQTVQPDRVILWISETDYVFLPAKIKSLEKTGLEIRFSKNYGPYTKIIPTLSEFPDAFVATADDDIFYTADWLERMIVAWDQQPHQIVCHRAHQILLDSTGLPLSYNDWPLDVEGPLISDSIFPTGVGGVLYPPHSLDPQVVDSDTFLRLSPKADDVWLYFMGRKNGAVYKKTPGRDKHILWPRSQKISLRQENQINGANDPKIRKMIEEYGWPKFIND